MSATVTDAARELLVQSLRGQAESLRQGEKRCAQAYPTPGPLRDSAQTIARAYEQAAEVFELALSRALLEEDPQSEPGARLRSIVPSELVDAFEHDPIVHGMLTRAAINGLDRRQALIELVKELVRARAELAKGFADHMQQCDMKPFLRR